MKNLKQIKKDISEKEKEILRLGKDLEKERDEKKQKKLITLRKGSEKELLFLREIEKYLEFEPREEFCREEKARLERISNAAYESWNAHYQANREAMDRLPMKSITERKAKFLKDIDLALMKNQIKTLNFILS